jgi:hypothetical protein
MGAFVLYPAGSRRERKEKITSGLTEAGFAVSHELTGAFGAVTLFDPLQGGRESYYEAENGDFIFCVGSFLYRGKGGHEALRLMLADFNPETFNWSGTRGICTVGVFRQGKLTLFTDGLGASKIYTDRDHGVFSSAFFAVVCHAAPVSIDAQGCYQYAWNGSVFGERTFLNEIRSVPSNTLLVLDAAVATIQKPSPYLPGENLGSKSLGDAAEAMVARLRDLFATYAAVYGDRFYTALSGGYDSRLLLAALLDAGITPDVFVYGHPDSKDVQVAREATARIGLNISASDNAALPEDRVPEEFPAQIARNFMVFDGWGYAGLFSGPQNYRSRMTRANGRIATNGSVGEVYRNFHYLPDGRFLPRDVVHAFYFQLDPAACTGEFSLEEYTDTLAGEMARAIGHTGGPLEREQVEMLYPLFRGRYWSARDAVINQRFGTMVYPYMEAEVVRPTYTIPLQYKSMGLMEAEMIRILNPALAVVNSDYGFAFDRNPTLKYRLSYLQSSYRPTWLRKYSYRVRHRKPASFPYFLTEPYLSRVIDTSFPHMSPFFQMDRVFDAEAYNRVATMEYVMQNWN